MVIDQSKAWKQTSPTFLDQFDLDKSKCGIWHHLTRIQWKFGWWEHFDPPKPNIFTHFNPFISFSILKVIRMKGSLGYFTTSDQKSISYTNRIFIHQVWTLLNYLVYPQGFTERSKSLKMSYGYKLTNWRKVVKKERQISTLPF